MIWPPLYSVKTHPRARRVKLRMSKQQGLQITVPPRFNLAYIADILTEHKDWIIHKFSTLSALNQIVALPNEIVFSALSQTWTIKYISADINLRLMQGPMQNLTLVGKQHQPTAKKLLLRWIKQQAKISLPLALDTISQQIKLPYQKVTVRDQRTRWGSCTGEKNISLNYKLLFLPPELMRNIIIHELCHTVYLNHSEKFWQLVAKFDPLFQQHNKAIRKAERLLPAWISTE